MAPCYSLCVAVAATAPRPVLTLTTPCYSPDFHSQWGAVIAWQVLETE